MKIIQSKRIWTSSYEKLEESLSDAETLFEFLEMGESSISEVEKAFQQTLKQTEDLELKKMLASEEDQLSAMLQINPGAGGTESNDWAGILMRMYIMWGESNGYKVREVDFQAGDVAEVPVGLKPALKPCNKRMLRNPKTGVVKG